MNPRSSRRRATLALAGLPLALRGVPSASQTLWPERPLLFLCPWPAGGTADQTMRALCGAAARVLGRPIAVENRAGAAGMIGLKALAAARPDGYTIGQVPISVTRFAQLGTVAIDPLRDLSYIARTSGQTFGIAVLAGAPWKTLGEFVAAARAQPGRVSYGSSGIGGATHVGMEEFALAAGVQLNHVPFKGGAEALQNLLGGHVDALADSSSWAPHVHSGRLRLLATWGDQRTRDFADVPTLRESGFDVVVDAPNGVAAPRGVDPAIVLRLREAFRQAVQSPEFVAACARIDAPVMYLDGPDYQRYVAEVWQRETRLIERLKLRELLSRG